MNTNRLNPNPTVRLNCMPELKARLSRGQFYNFVPIVITEWLGENSGITINRLYLWTKLGTYWIMMDASDTQHRGQHSI